MSLIEGFLPKNYNLCVVKKVYSSSFEIKRGPMYTVLGPPLFNIYANDLMHTIDEYNGISNLIRGSQLFLILEYKPTETAKLYLEHSFAKAFS